MGGMMMNSQTTPELRTAPKIWLCVDPQAKSITASTDLLFKADGTAIRYYTDDDFAEQLVAAAIEERLK